MRSIQQPHIKLDIMESRIDYFNIIHPPKIAQEENKKQGNLSRNRLSSFFPLLRKNDDLAL